MRAGVFLLGGFASLAAAAAWDAGASWAKTAAVEVASLSKSSAPASSASARNGSHSLPRQRPTPAKAASKEITIAAGGDVMLGRWTERGWRPHGVGNPFGKWLQMLRGADLAFVNLETGICEQGRTRSFLPLLWAPPVRLGELVDAGIDVVSVANNHALDCGGDGLSRSVEELRARGILAVGVAPTGAIQVGADVWILAATFHLPPYRCEGACPLAATKAELPARVAALHEQNPAALVVVSLHWGGSRTSRPAAWQRHFARKLIDAGAQAVLGHGSHTPQPRETYGGGIILYSLGNLVFDDRSALGHPQPPALLLFAKTDGRWSFVSTE